MNTGSHPLRAIFWPADPNTEKETLTSSLAPADLTTDPSQCPTSQVDLLLHSFKTLQHPDNTNHNLQKSQDVIYIQTLTYQTNL